MRPSLTVLSAMAIAMGLGLTANAATVTYKGTDSTSDIDNLSSPTSAGTVAPYGGTDWRVWYSSAAHNASGTVELKDEKKNAENIGDLSFTASSVQGLNTTDGNGWVTWDATDAQSNLAKSGVVGARINDGTVSGRIDGVGAAGDVWFVVAGWATTVDTAVELYDSNNTLLDSDAFSQGMVGNTRHDVWFSYSGNTDSGSYILYTLNGEVSGTSDDM